LTLNNELFILILKLQKKIMIRYNEIINPSYKRYILLAHPQAVHKLLLLLRVCLNFYFLITSILGTWLPIEMVI